MKVMIAGKSAKNGTSQKTGKPYNATIIYYTSAEEGVEGSSVGDAWIDDSKCHFADIAVGKAYNLEFDKKGFIRVFAPA